MERHRDKPTSEQDASSQDDLGRFIRWALEDSVSGAEPSAKVWPRILSRVRVMSASAGPERPQRRPWFPVAPLVQAVLISVLLLAFGLGVDRNVTVSRRQSLVKPTPALEKASVRAADQLEDTLSGHVLFRRHQEPLSQKIKRIKVDMLQ